jgi:hypothetical protein
MEFTEFPKLARMFRKIIITEKIDGTNAQILIREISKDDVLDEYDIPVDSTTGLYAIRAGSRTRWIRPGKDNDNFGFAGWVSANAAELLELGVGTHFGEWWGSGIQRGYGLQEKRFSLFNTQRWLPHGFAPKEYPTSNPTVMTTRKAVPACCGVVPVLYEGDFFETAIMESANSLRHSGSYAAPGFSKPEGLVMFHTAANQGFKYTLDNDGVPKSKVIATKVGNPPIHTTFEWNLK